MQFVRSISGKAVILIGFIFCLITYQKLDRLNENNWRCINLADGFGYYMYLPHLFEKGNLNIKSEWAQNLQDEYCNSCPAYQLVPRKNGNEINMYQMGLSYLMLPAYTIGDLSARMGGYKTDGFTTPYHVTYFLNALLFIFLGLLYLQKLLKLFVSDTIVGITLILIYLGSNAFVTFDSQIDMPHLYLFTLNSVFLYHLFKFRNTKNNKTLLYAALFFGLTTSIRPTQALMGLIPLIILFKEYGNSKQFWKSILLFPLLSLLWNIPQILYWKLVGDELITLNLHTEDIVLADPNLWDFLFSFRKGWLLYSPIFLVSIIGFIQLFRNQKNLFWALLSFALLYIWVLSSWETWYYAQSFGSRVMVDIYPVIAIAMAIGLYHLKKPALRISVGLFAVFCLLLNQFQSMQVHKGYLHAERMTQEHYWYIFGKASIDNYNESRLLINRKNTNWQKLQQQFPSSQRELVTREIFSLKKSIRSQPTKDLDIAHINVLDLVQTDETLFEVHVRAKTSDHTQSSELRMECVSPYNVYSWNNFEISQELKTDNEYQDLVFRYNLPEIRHDEDEMQIYLDNDADVSVEIESFTIIATSLIRK